MRVLLAEDERDLNQIITKKLSALTVRKRWSIFLPQTMTQ